MATRRTPIAGRFTAQEVALAARNRGMPLEALRHELTPAGLHYLLIHFDIPPADERALEFRGLFQNAFSIEPAELKRLPSKTLRVTLECAGNGRGQLAPRYPSVPWLEEGMSTADWTGVPLSHLLDKAGLKPTATEIVFHGADRGIDAGVEHHFARSLARDEALREDVLLAYAMNGAPLPPQHGAPLRLVVPRWYGMASVKWLQAIEALDRPFDGFQQARGYHFRRAATDQGEPCTLMRVNSAMAPPGIPDFYTRRRVVDAGTTLEIVGRAWSGSAPIARVELAVDGAWRDAHLEESASFCWQRWRASWHADPGEHELACRATDRAGNVQPLEPPWDVSGFGNNSVQKVSVTVRA